MFHRHRAMVGVLVWLLAARGFAGPGDGPLKFQFGRANPEAGYVQVAAATAYTKERGYGFEDASGLVSLAVQGCSANAPFKFDVDLPYGNYDVSVTVGDAGAPSNTAVRAQWRRLMVDDIATAAGRTETRTFTVNVDTGRLDIEFVGKHPSVDRLEIKRNEAAITVYIAGDSTVCDQEHEPFAGWGQILPVFFKPGGVAVANHARSGRAANSFVREKRLDKILATIRPGDYLFVQFAHNDMKQPAMQPFTTYKAAMQVYIDEARKRQAIPVLVTSMHRRFFNSDGTVQNTLKEFPEAVRQLAAEQHVALIDLNAMSKTFYEALGPEKSKLAFAQYPANTFPGQEKELKDNTHFNEYGAFELARCVAEAIRKSDLPLAKQVVEDLPGMNAAKPVLKPAGPTTRGMNKKPLATPEGS
jgi:lysophospholipase L1-like esterase